MKTYCALGFGNNFFYPLGTDSLPIPQHLLIEEEEDEEDATATEDSSGEDDNGVVGEDADNKIVDSEDDNEDDPLGAQASLLPINPSGRQIINSEDNEVASSASEWIQSHLPSRTGGGDSEHTKYSTNVKPLLSCGATHTSFILPKQNASTTTSSTATVGGDAHLVGTIFGHSYHNLTVQPTRLPLKIVRISSGRRHVLALTEGASPGGGVVMSWGAGHFGQLGHGPELTSCLEPRIVERLLPHVVGGNVIEIAAGGLHSAAIVATPSKNQKVFPQNGSGSHSEGKEIIIRETKTFAWGSNRKGQCGIEGGKCATVPEPLPVIMVKRGENTKRDGDSTKTDPVDKNVHFEKLSLGRLHTVALTAYGEVFTWGSTSMGRCGHSSIDSGRGSDRRFVQQPRHVSALRNVAIEAIAAGAAHTLALSRGGRVFAWGAGGDGQCGQGHAGNLFSPRAVQGLPTSSSSSLAKGQSKMSLRDIHDTKGKDSGEGHMPHVNSKVALEVSMEEEALSKALSMSQISNIISPPPPEPKSEKIVSIRASGCYSAAITGGGDVYTWGYGSGAALGHPIPTQEKTALPLIPIIEGNQYSTTTAAKVFPEGGSEDNKIRDCKCFDTDLNVMLPRKVECTRTLGLRAEDVSLGPGHMVILCSTGSNSDDNVISNSTKTGQSLHNTEEDGQDAETDVPMHNTDETKQPGTPGSTGQGLGSPNDTSPYCGVTTKKESAHPGGGDTATTLESHDSSPKAAEKRRRSPGFLMKIKSSRTSKHCSSQSLGSHGPEGGGGSGEKKRSFMHVGKMLGVRRSGEK